MSRDLTKGTFGGHLLALAPAAVATQMVMAAFEVVDTWWIGRTAAGEAGLAALGVGSYCLWCLFALGFMIETAVLAVGGQAIGAGREDAARRTVGRGFVFAVIVGIVTWVVAWPLAGPIAGSMELSDEAAGLGAEYLRILFAGSVSIYGFAATDAAFRARGDTRTPLVLLLGSFGLNAVLDPLLIFGAGPIPAMGLAGAAWATVVTRALGVLAGLWILSRRGQVAFRPWRLMFVVREFRRFVFVGAPASIGGFVYCVAFLGLARVLGVYGDDVVGAFAVGQKIEGISWACLFGISTVTVAWVGQNLGAGQIERAAQGVWRSALWAGIFSFFASLLFMGLAQPLCALFAPGQERLQEFGRQYLMIVAIGQIPLAIELVIFQGFAGAGDTVPPMVIMSVFTLARVPLAQWLAHDLGWGPEGVFWSVTITTAIKGLLMVLWFRRGRWVAKSYRVLSGMDD